LLCIFHLIIAIFLIRDHSSEEWGKAYKNILVFHMFFLKSQSSLSILSEGERGGGKGGKREKKGAAYSFHSISVEMGFGPLNIGGKEKGGGNGTYFFVSHTVTIRHTSRREERRGREGAAQSHSRLCRSIRLSILCCEWGKKHLKLALLLKKKKKKKKKKKVLIDLYRCAKLGGGGGGGGGGEEGYLTPQSRSREGGGGEEEKSGNVSSFISQLVIHCLRYDSGERGGASGGRERWAGEKGVKY